MPGWLQGLYHTWESGSSETRGARMADTPFNGSSNKSSGPSATSSMEDPTHTAREVVSALTTFTCLWGMVGNGVVIWLLSFCLQRGPVGVYVLNRAVADLLFLLCMAVLTVLRASAWKSFVSPLVLLATRSAKYLAYTASLSLLVALTTQHCFSILFPIWYRCHRPRHLSALVSTLLWVLSFLLTTLILYFYNEPWNADSKEGARVDTIFHILTLMSFTPGMVLSSVFLVHVYRNPQQWRRQPWRLLVGILALILVFLVCTLPLSIASFILYWVSLPQQTQTLLSTFGHLTLSVNSSANPFVYFLVGSQGCDSLQEPLGAVLSRVLQEDPGQEGRETSSMGTDKHQVVATAASLYLCQLNASDAPESKAGRVQSAI
ncbi:mas-related G-protein coupled receptor member D-like [Elephas maximus indicus]|uniref:mas-related G-protein coupled receptor member D-like n=1 Tax=Elephas maximus indicus TaxID=99487 RepID=UPI0021171D2A|nr:mas-related G-protein coupled receptor member D-like [Elephas maximus indicus]